LLVATKDVPVGGGVIVSGHEVVVTQPVSGTFVGVSSICTHQQCPVTSVTDGKIICPCHNSEFDLKGAVVQGPATQALPTKQIRVANGQVYLV
jgi:Rieske Fe-S protein